MSNLNPFIRYAKVPLDQQSVFLFFHQQLDLVHKLQARVCGLASFCTDCALDSDLQCPAGAALKKENADTKLLINKVQTCKGSINYSSNLNGI